MLFRSLALRSLELGRDRALQYDSFKAPKLEKLTLRDTSESYHAKLAKALEDEVFLPKLNNLGMDSHMEKYYEKVQRLRPCLRVHVKSPSRGVDCSSSSARSSN